MKYLFLAYMAAFAAWAVPVVGADMATRKIPNARMLLGAKLLGLALLVLAANTLLGVYGLSASFLNWNFYPMFALHALLAAVAGVVLWYSEVWPAGDAKFYILTAAWLPLINPFITNFPGYLFLSLLINIFIAAGLVAMGNFVVSGLHKANPADFFREMFSGLAKRFAEQAGGKGGWPRAGMYLANMTFLFLLQQVINAESRHLLSRFLSRPDLLYFFMFFLWGKIAGAFQSKRWLYVSTAFYVVYFAAGWFLFRERLSWLLMNSLANVFKFSMLLFFGRFMLEFLLEKKDTVYVRPHELQPGMILESKAAQVVKGNPVFGDAFDDNFKDGLSEEQAGLVRDWLVRTGVPDPRIAVVTGRPFALWILAGAVLTLVLDRNLASYFR